MTEVAYKRAYRHITASPQWRSDDVIEHWLEALRRAGRSADTVRIYASALNRWLEFAADPLDPGRSDIAAWVRARTTALKRSTCNLEFSAVRVFYRWLYVEGYTPVDCSRRLPRTHRAPKRLVRYLDVDQMARLLAAPNLAVWSGFRDHVMLRLLYETGIRAGELVRLTLGDVLPDRVLHVEGRFLPLSEELARLLMEWQRLRAQVRPGKSATLFLTHHGRPFSRPRAIWQVVNRYAWRALGMRRGYERIQRAAGQRPWSGMSAHLLRASFATALLHSGCDIRYVQALLGHTDVATTARYLGVDIEALKREHAKLRRASPPRPDRT